MPGSNSDRPTSDFEALMQADLQRIENDAERVRANPYLDSISVSQLETIAMEAYQRALSDIMAAGHVADDLRINTLMREACEKAVADIAQSNLLRWQRGRTQAERL